jgi:hypothetical protein
MLRSPLRAYKTGADTNDRLGRQPTNRKTTVPARSLQRSGLLRVWFSGASARLGQRAGMSPRAGELSAADNPLDANENSSRVIFACAVVCTLAGCGNGHISTESARSALESAGFHRLVVSRGQGLEDPTFDEIELRRNRGSGSSAWYFVPLRLSRYHSDTSPWRCPGGLLQRAPRPWTHREGEAHLAGEVSLTLGPAFRNDPRSVPG